jgi:[ribosomal protein S5]-alanine N-acetyltransferase
MTSFEHLDLMLETPRLRLRPPRIDDAEDIFRYASDPDVTRFLIFGPHTQLSQSVEFSRERLKRIAEGTSITWVILEKTEERPFGAIELSISGGEGDVGYVLAKSHWGRGIAPEAVRAVLKFAREQLSLERVNGSCDWENTKSARVFEKCGFRSLGPRESLLVHPALGAEPRPALYFEYVFETDSGRT